MKKNKDLSKGFSLIELLVGISIIITATTVVLAIIVSSFRISSKNTSNEVVRQSGNNAMSQLSRRIQFADSFVGVSNNSAFSGAITICEVSPRSIDGIEAPLTPYKYVRVTYNEVSTTFACEDNELKLNNVSMTNSPNISAPSSSCYFTCTQDSTAVAPVIGVNYDLQRGDGTGVSEKNAKMNFSTKIKMRNQ